VSDDLKARAEELMRVCGPHDYGLNEHGCTCPTGDPRPVISALLEALEKAYAAVAHLDAVNAELSGQLQDVREQLAGYQMETTP
jgi:hypothetical protein